MKRFLSIGECMIEMAPQDDGRYAMGFAGDTFNTAWYARRVADPEIEVGYLSAIGDDTPSRQMQSFMEAAGIVPRLTIRKGQTVGLYMISLKDGERSFAYWRSVAAARSLADDLETLPDLVPGDMAFFSGITMAILPDSGRERLLEVLETARKSGIQVAFDPNLRPRLWPDTDTMCHWITRAAGVSDIALPSFEDEADYFGDTDPDATARRYTGSGVSLIVVKNGPEPILIRQDGTDLHHTPSNVSQVTDTTAAGDSFNAGFLMASMAGKTLDVAAGEGSALAARVISARGALVPV